MIASGVGTGTGMGRLLFGEKEQEEYKYLGIWFSGLKGMFQTQVKNIIKSRKIEGGDGKCSS